MGTNSAPKPSPTTATRTIPFSIPATSFVVHGARESWPRKFKWLSIRRGRLMRKFHHAHTCDRFIRIHGRRCIVQNRSSQLFIELYRSAHFHQVVIDDGLTSFDSNFQTREAWYENCSFRAVN